MDLFSKLRDGITAVRAGDHLEALTLFLQAAGEILGQLRGGPTPASAPGAPSVASAVVPPAGGDVDADTKADELDFALSAPQPGQAPGALGGGMLLKLLPLVLELIDALRRRP